MKVVLESPGYDHSGQEFVTQFDWNSQSPLVVKFSFEVIHVLSQVPLVEPINCVFVLWMAKTLLSYPLLPTGLNILPTATHYNPFLYIFQRKSRELSTVVSQTKKYTTHVVYSAKLMLS